MMEITSWVTPASSAIRSHNWCKCYNLCYKCYIARRLLIAPGSHFQSQKDFHKHCHEVPFSGPRFLIQRFLETECFGFGFNINVVFIKNTLVHTNLLLTALSIYRKSLILSQHVSHQNNHLREK